MAYSISVESSFSAAHRLRDYRGKCENLHGHNWRVKVTISAKRLKKPGMVMDFKEAKETLESIISILDHSQLDKMEFFKKLNPTSELIAEFIFNRYKKSLGKKAVLESVSVWETDTSCATYSRE